MSSMNIIWFLFQVCGVFPIANQHKNYTPTSRISRFLLRSCSAILLKASCVMIWYTYTHQNHIFYTRDTIGNINDVIKYVSLSLAGLVILIQPQLCRSRHEKIWECVHKIKQTYKLPNIDYNSMDAKLNRSFSIKFYIIFLIFACVEYRVCLAVYDISLQWSKLWSVSMYPLVICRMLYLLHTFYMEMLRNFLRSVKLEMKQIVELSEKTLQSEPNIDRKEIIERLLVLKGMFGVLWELNMHINEAVSWSQAFNITQIFVQSTCDLHWMYKSFDHNFPGKVTINDSL
jgi:hypothetical protein